MCRDEERICDAHIAGSHHYASDGFADRLPEIAEATRGKETPVLQCAFSQVRSSFFKIHLMYVPS